MNPTNFESRAWDAAIDWTKRYQSEWSAPHIPSGIDCRRAFAEGAYWSRKDTIAEAVKIIKFHAENNPKWSSMWADWLLSELEQK